jgi:threonine dehydrogenase-like Zn-dependent dehydrogenase
MWSAYLDSGRARAAMTRAFAVASRRAHFGPFAPLRTRQIRQSALPGDHWVRVRNTMAGIADDEVARVLLARGSEDERALPRVRRFYLGREVCGEVVEVGPGTDFLRIGDRVALQTGPCCATRELEPPCRLCAAGLFNICENRYRPGPDAVGGAWGDEMIVHERQLFLVPDALTDEQAALLDPAAVALHAVLRHPPQARDSALVIGGGTLGLLTIQAIRALAPSVAITVEARYPFQTEAANALGAAQVLARAEGSAGVARYTQAQRYKRGGSELLVGGFDVVYDTVGTGESVQNALRWVRGGGAVVLAGSHPARSRLDLTPMLREEVRVLGARDHGTERWPGDSALAGWEAESGGRVSTFQLAAVLMRERRLTPERLITHRFPLRDLRHAIRVARDQQEHKALKVMLDVREAPSIPLEELEFADDPLPELASPTAPSLPSLPRQGTAAARSVPGRPRF